MMVAVGLARVGVGVKIRTPAYTLIYPHLDQQMIIMTLIMGMLVMVVKYHQMLSTTVHKHIRIHPEASQTSWLMYFVRRKVPRFKKCPFSKSAPYQNSNSTPLPQFPQFPKNCTGQWSFISLSLQFFTNSLFLSPREPTELNSGKTLILSPTMPDSFCHKRHESIVRWQISRRKKRCQKRALR